MSKPRLSDLLIIALFVFVCASVVWREVEAFQEFQHLSAGEGFFAYLASGWRKWLTFLLISLGYVFLAHWWSRQPKVDPDQTEFHEPQGH